MATVEVMESRPTTALAMEKAVQTVTIPTVITNQRF